MKVSQSRSSSQVSDDFFAASLTQMRESVQTQMRGAAMALLMNLFGAEVELLCGTPFSRKGEQYCYRGGTEDGSVLFDGQRVAVKRPRIRDDGGEVELKTYNAMQDYDVFNRRIMDHMLRGVSTRNYDQLLNEVEGGLGVSKSVVSRAFKGGSLAALNEINSRPLSDQRFLAIMIDGIGFGDRVVIVAMGITQKGKKMIIGIREGDTENWQICRDLLTALIDRGLSTSEPILFVIDGAKALKKAIVKVMGKMAFIQRCVRHKERNVIKYLPAAYHMEFRRRWKLLHGITSWEEAVSTYRELVEWLGGINHAAMQSLEESEAETLTIIRLKTPPVLRKTLASTNPLESTFARTTSITGRVKNWGSGKDQISRWAAVTLMEAEKRFISIPGSLQLVKLRDRMRELIFPVASEVAAAV